ncbi:hypothetical protein YC2023_023955 [Brassica napus]
MRNRHCTMNCLSTLLDKTTAEGKFGYHYKCAKSKITHLCFADDLLIFTEGSTQSIQGVLNVLSDFQSRSGLAISISKTCFFSCELSQQEVKK